MILYPKKSKNSTKSQKQNVYQKIEKEKWVQDTSLIIPCKDRILMLLMYYRMYKKYDILGMIVDLDKSNGMRDIKYLEPAVKCSIPIPTKK